MSKSALLVALLVVLGCGTDDPPPPAEGTSILDGMQENLPPLIRSESTNDRKIREQSNAAIAKLKELGLKVEELKPPNPLMLEGTAVAVDNDDFTPEGAIPERAFELLQDIPDLMLVVEREKIPRVVFQQIAKLEQLRGIGLGGDFDRQDFHLLSRCRRLEGVFARSENVADDEMRMLSQLPMLKGLDITISKVTDAGLAHLERLPHLKVVRAFDTLVTDQGVAKFRAARPAAEILADRYDGSVGLDDEASQKALRDLGVTLIGDRDGRAVLVAFGESTATARDLRHLKGLHALREISLRREKSDPQFTDAALMELAKLPKLETLWLDGSAVTDEGVRLLRQLPRLTKVNLSNTRITDRALETLAELPNLLDLSLNNTAITDRGVSLLAKRDRLQSLAIHGTRITDRGMKIVGQFAELESLIASNTTVTDAGFRSLQNLRKLTYLDLAWTQITNEGLRHLTLPELEDLSLAHCTGLTGDGLPALKGIPKLEHLNLTGTQIADADLKHLAGLDSLEQLTLSETKITGTGLGSLHTLPHLGTLGLSRTALTDAALPELLKFRKLAHLGLYECPGLSDAALEKLAQTLGYNNVGW